MRAWLERVLGGGAAEGGPSLPRKVRALETSYDPATGGYRTGDPRQPLTYAHVEREVGRLWYAMVMLLRPRRVLETGTHQGYSTSLIAAGLRDLDRQDGTSGRHVVTIDPAPLSRVYEGTELASYITHLEMMSQDAIAKVDEVLGPEPLDMLVLDSDHHYDTIVRELMVYEPRLRAGGAILMHDSLFYDGVGLAVRQLAANPRFEVVTFDSPRRTGRIDVRCPGITLVRKRADGVPSVRFEKAHSGVEVGDWFETPVLREADAALGRVELKPRAAGAPVRG